MDEFFLYKQLCDLENIALQYTEGKKYCETIKEAAEEISSRTYRVAVIGEFKRGKSSLINALIGAEVLPTDVLPMTAAVTKLVYGVERKIFINYKDGSVKERTIEELLDFATKYDKAKEKTALSVRDIEVRYPSVFCKNHIEIFDTPGLNDNESMSAVTLGVIGEVDAAIVVVSARNPLDLTEQNLIIDLLKESGVRHLIFVVTFIDVVGREKEKDSIIDFIRNRISNEVLDRAIADNAVDDNKARSILTKPDIFGVSSKQAMESFINDDEELLEKSRFSVLKEELLALLTAAQSADLQPKTAVTIDRVEKYLPKWMQTDEDVLQEKKRKIENNIDRLNNYITNSKTELISLLQHMDRQIAEYGISKKGIEIDYAKVEENIKNTYIKALASLNVHNNTHENIYHTLVTATTEFMKIYNGVMTNLSEHIQRECLEPCIIKFAGIRENAKISNDSLKKEMDKRKGDFPQFEWVTYPVPTDEDLRGVNVIPFVRHAVREALVEYSKKVLHFFNEWRLVLLNKNKQDIAELSKILLRKEEEQKNIVMEQNILKHNFSQHMAKIIDIKEKVNQ